MNLIVEQNFAASWGQNTQKPPPVYKSQNFKGNLVIFQGCCMSTVQKRIQEQGNFSYCLLFDFTALA